MLKNEQIRGNIRMKHVPEILGKEIWRLVKKNIGIVISIRSQISSYERFFF